MSRRVEEATEWIYRGVWRVIVDWLRVPAEPPTLPAHAAEYIASFQPAPGFLTYLKFWFWIVLALTDIAFTGAYIAAAIALWMADLWWIAVLLFPIAAFIIVAPDVVAYIAIHLRYDTTWYVMTDRSLRIRRGIWIIHETTITFENVQNLKVQQGPLQRHYGIANLVVETAGAGGEHQGKGGVTNRGVIEGIANAHELRDRILLRMRQSKTAGLGDEAAASAAASTWTAQHLAVLREIRDEARAMADATHQREA